MSKERANIWAGGWVCVSRRSRQGGTDMRAESANEDRRTALETGEFGRTGVRTDGRGGNGVRDCNQVVIFVFGLFCPELGWTAP